jgi:ankyrin repeat protein
MPVAFGSCLEYAIYHSPVSFIRELLEIGADPNPMEHDGFPPLIATISCSRSHAGSPKRHDMPEILQLLLSYGADPNQRGVNDYTPLHMAVDVRNLPALRILLDAGADPLLRTRIDDVETPRELAERSGLTDFIAVLVAAEARSRG